MSPKLQIPTVPLRVVKVIESVEAWEIREVEAGDIALVKKGESAGHWECDARDLLEALLSVKSAKDLVEFVRNYRDPGINDREYLGIQEAIFEGRPMTWKNYVVRPQSKIFLSQVRDFQRVLKQAIAASVSRWQFTEWFDPEGLSIELELKNGRLQGVCRFHTGAEACLALIYLDKVTAGMEYGWCCLCGAPFRRTSRHERKYCTKRCAHTAAMRSHRNPQEKLGTRYDGSGHGESCTPGF
jgi:hypothetical protein